MRKVIVIGLVILLAVGIVRFMGISVSTLVLFVIAAFAGGFILGRRRRATK